MHLSRAVRLSRLPPLTWSAKEPVDLVDRFELPGENLVSLVTPLCALWHPRTCDLLTANWRSSAIDA